MGELKPCPFCKGTVDLVQTMHETLGNRRHHYVCRNSGAIVFLYVKGVKYKSKEETDKEAIEVWNRRTDND